MNKRNLWFYGLLLAIIIVLFLLITGSSILLITLDKNHTIPLGTFITWTGIISLPLVIFWGSDKFRKPKKPLYKYLSKLLKILIVLSILWVPISYLLAGNIAFTFGEKETFQGGQQAMKWFWRYTYGITIVPVILIIFHWILLLLNKLKQ